MFNADVCKNNLSNNNAFESANMNLHLKETCQYLKK